MPMKDGGAVLTVLRNQPGTAIAAWGFLVRGAALGNPLGGGCTLTCARHRESSVYQIDVVAGGPDWYIPFADGKARHCDVPRGQPSGTLVVTFPMNGCALEVHATETGNRFFHDSDGKSMVRDGLGAAKYRADYSAYAGPENTTHERSLRYFGVDADGNVKENAGGYEHSVICVKVGGDWQVFSSAVMRVNQDAWQIKDQVPYALGRFAD